MSSTICILFTVSCTIHSNVKLLFANQTITMLAALRIQNISRAENLVCETVKIGRFSRLVSVLLGCKPYFSASKKSSLESN